jgi:dethiobiotin synthetase
MHLGKKMAGWRLKRQFFVTGTDTGVGKTYFSAWLAAQWVKQGRVVAALKPIACGDREDAKQLRSACGDVLSIDEVNGQYFQRPLAPWPAARFEGKEVSLAQSIREVRRQEKRFPHLLVEGVGGWVVPLTERKSVEHWAIRLELPVLIVARAGLGTLNHTLLTVHAVQRSGCRCAGIVLNAGKEGEDLAAKSNPQVLSRLTKVPIWVFTPKAEKEGHLPEWLS